MAKKTTRVSRSARATTSRAASPAASRAARATTSRAAKGDLSLPSLKDNKKKWLYIAAAIVILLGILYFATGGQLFSGLGTLWPE